jgi:hypothetical protein
MDVIAQYLKKPYLRGEGGYYSLDRPPLMDEMLGSAFLAETVEKP